MQVARTHVVLDKWKQEQALLQNTEEQKSSGQMSWTLLLPYHDAFNNRVIPHGADLEGCQLAYYFSLVLFAFIIPHSMVGLKEQVSWDFYCFQWC